MILNPRILDLFEARNISQVSLCIFSLGWNIFKIYFDWNILTPGRATQNHPEYTGPTLGPKMATKNERNFTEEQIRQGRDAVIGLQSGSNKGASQVIQGDTGCLNTPVMKIDVKLLCCFTQRLHS